MITQSNSDTSRYLLDPHSLYAPVMSVDAIRVLKEHKIPAYYDKTTEMIINRTGDGRCPIDSSVVDVEDPQEALARIRETIARLKS